MKSNESKYRYDRVTMGILMSDFAFSKGSAEPGVPFPFSGDGRRTCELFDVSFLSSKLQIEKGAPEQISGTNAPHHGGGFSDGARAQR